jgi:hypothetical protein
MMMLLQVQVTEHTCWRKSNYHEMMLLLQVQVTDVWIHYENVFLKINFFYVVCLLRFL